MKSAPLALAAAGLFLATGCASTVASVEGPAHRQKRHTPAPVSVTLNAKKADAGSFRATANGRDITDAFVFDGDRAELSGYAFEPGAPRQPHTLTFEAQPAVNDKGRPLGKPFSESLTFFPPVVTLQGNVGLSGASHVSLPPQGRSSVMIRLPVPVSQATEFTVTPVPLTRQVSGVEHLETLTDCVAVNNGDAGAAQQVTVSPGNRVAVFTVRGQHPGVTALRVQAPGYVVAEIEVLIDAPASVARSAQIDTP